MRVLLFLLCVSLLVGCSSTHQTRTGDGRVSSRRATRRSQQPVVSGDGSTIYDERIHEASRKLLNIYTLTEKALIERFGEPQSIKTDAENPAARWLHFQSRSGRIIDAQIENDRVVDVNYSATGGGGGNGAGRKEKARNDALKHQKQQRLEAREVVRDMYDHYGPGDVTAYVGMIRDSFNTIDESTADTLVREEIAIIIKEAQQRLEEERAQQIKEAEAQRQAEADRMLRAEEERVAEEMRLAALSAENAQQITHAALFVEEDSVQSEEVVLVSDFLNTKRISEREAMDEERDYA